MESLPIACTLSPAALKARKANLLNVLLRRADERGELPDGHRLRFAPEGDILSEIARMVDAERQCCRFLRFTLAVEPEGGPISLDLTGPAGTREFLKIATSARLITRCCSTWKSWTTALARAIP